MILIPVPGACSRYDEARESLYPISAVKFKSRVDSQQLTVET